MEHTTRLGYICAGLGLGGALGVLLAPGPGAQTRDRLRDAAARGRDGVRARAHDVRDAFERRNDLLQAGKEHAGRSLEVGRSAYREAVAETVKPPIPSFAAVGLLVFEAAALAAAYRLAAGLKGNLREVGPHLESLLDTSRAAVAEGSRQISSMTSKADRILGVVEHVVEALSKQSA